ncbi:MAG: hypothetical protein AB7O26_10740 [Planctomycetaceae bacterium]
MPTQPAATLDEEAPISRSSMERAPGPSYEERLALSRRLDWRFLLTDPRLLNAAVVGRCDPQLRKSLELFSPTTIYHRDAVELSAETREFDLVIVQGGHAALVKAAAPRVKPGGSIYIENRRRLRNPSTWFTTSAQATKQLRQLGFESIDVHWHWPKFTSATSFLPIHDGDSAARYFFKHQATSLRGWCKSSVGKLAIALGFRDLMIGCFSVTGRKVSK